MILTTTIIVFLFTQARKNKVVMVLLVIVLLIALIGLLYCLSTYVNIHRLLHPGLYNRVFIEDDHPHHETIDSSIVIYVLCRDIAPQFEMSARRLESIGRLFDRYKIVVFENDSVDGSRELLENWASENPGTVELLDCCDRARECSADQHRCKLNLERGYNSTDKMFRFEKMAKYRNRCLSHILERYGHLYEYVMAYDFDIQGAVSREGILDTFRQRDRWDAVFANGRSFQGTAGTVPHVYDRLAFQEHGLEKHSSSLVDFWRQHRGVNSSEGLYPVYSAFNGIGIYRMDALFGARYRARDPPNQCEHLGLHSDMRANGYGRLYINPRLVVYVGMQGPSIVQRVRKLLS